MSGPVLEGVDVDELSPEQARDLLDSECHRELGVASQVFLDAYRSGELPKEWPDVAVCRLEMLLPLAS